MSGGTRGWTRFLTERDTRLLERTSWAKREPFGLGARPAVVVVDAYYGALGERGLLLDQLDTWPAACGPEGWAAVTGPSASWPPPARPAHPCST